MRKSLVFIMLVILSFGLIACDRTTEPTATDPTPTVQPSPTPSSEPTPSPTPEPTPSEADTTAPVIYGAVDKQIMVGDTFDPMEGVTAQDDTDGDVTNKITVTGSVDVNTPGMYELTYKVKDAAGNEATKLRKITVAEDTGSDLVFTNGDFALPPIGNGWTHWAGEGGDSTVEHIDNMAVIDIKANGNIWYATQFNHPNLIVTQGNMYKIEIVAKADQARGMVVKLEDASYWGYIDELIELTDEFQTFEFEFYVSKPSITNGKLVIGLGNMATRPESDDPGALTKVYIKSVKATLVDPGEDTEAPVIIAPDIAIALGDPFDPRAGVTVSDNRDLTLTVDDLVITGTVDVDVEGEYELTYELTDASGNKATITRIVTVTSGVVPSTWLVVNGDFEVEQFDPLPQPAATGWGWHGAGKFNAEIKDGVAKIEVTDPGTVVHGVQFYQQSRVITQGQIYKISFDAKADIARPIMVALEENVTRRYDEIVHLTTEWETYEIYIDHVLAGYENGKFAFFMGDVGDNSVPTTIYLDNITVITVEELVDVTAPQLYGINNYIVPKDAPFDPLAGVIIRDNVDMNLTHDDIVIIGEVDTSVVDIYEITYKISDSAGNEGVYVRQVEVVKEEDANENTFTLVNGDFEVDQSTPYAQPAVDGWGWHGGGTFTIDIAEGIATIVVTDPGTVPHGVQFYQQNRIIATGATYLLKFKAKVEDPRAVRVSLEAGTTVRFFEIVEITDEWEEYEVVITPEGGGFTNGKFAFFPGYIDERSATPTTFYLDDVSIELIGYPKDEDNPFIFAKDLELPAGAEEYDLLDGVSIFDLTDKTLKVEDVVVTGEFDIDMPGVYELTYTLTDSSGNSTSITRRVVVSGELIPSTIVLVNGDFEEDQLVAVGQPATTGWGWHGAGNFTITIQDGVAKFEIRNPGTVVHGVQFYQQNRIVTKNQVYKITFKAKADIPREIMFALEAGTSRKFDEIIMVGDDWQEFEIIYKSPESYENGKFAFFLGTMGDYATATTVYLDDIEVVAIEEYEDNLAPNIFGIKDYIVPKDAPFDPLKGVTVRDNNDKDLTVDDIVVTGEVNTEVVGEYTLEYKVVDNAGNEAVYERVVTVVEEAEFFESSLIIINGDFEIDQAAPAAIGTGWGWHGGGTFTIDIADGIATIDVENPGTVPHGVQFYLQNRVVDADATYLLTFKAKVDDPRAIRISFEAGTDLKDFKVIDLTDEWATYEVLLRSSGYGYTNGKLGFFPGYIDERSATPTIFYLDDVEIKLIGYAVDNDAPLVVANDIEVEKDSVFDLLQGVLVYDLIDKTLTVDSLEVTGAVDTSILGTYEITYKATDASGNETEVVRTVTVVEPEVEPTP